MSIKLTEITHKNEYIENILRKCCEINNIVFPRLTNDNEIKREYKNILRLLSSEYSLFLTNKYYRWSKKFLLKYLDKYEITYLNYNCKNDILKLINVINSIIEIYNKIICSFNENINNKTKYEKSDIIFNLIEESKLNYTELTNYYKNIMTYKLVNDLLFILNIDKIKVIYYSDNEIEPNTLYKKISFSKEEIFFSFNMYLLKKREYKLRTFCQIAEKLGAKQIKIVSDLTANKTTNISGKLDLPTSNIEVSKKKSDSLDNKIDLHFIYSNMYTNLTLNKFYINQLVDEESEFLIPKEEFNSDIDFKFLIDARCINLIKKYNTKIIINHVNELENKLYFKAKDYGLSMEYLSNTSNFDSLNIEIEFIDIYKNPRCITGSNLYILKEGIWHLSNIINEEINIYRKSKCPKSNKSSNNTIEEKSNNSSDNTNDEKSNNPANNNNDEKSNTPSDDTSNSKSNTPSDTINDEPLSDTTIDDFLNDSSIFHSAVLVVNEKIVYNKIINFMIAQFLAVSKNQCNILSDHDKELNLLNVFNDIIGLNFKNNNDGTNELFYIFFKNDNITYDNYKKFRDILIFGDRNIEDMIFKENDEDLIHKFYFISIHYHKILNSNKILFKKVKKYIDETYYKSVLDNVTNSLYEENIIDKYEKNIINIKNNKEEKEITIKINNQNDILNNIFVIPQFKNIKNIALAKTIFEYKDIIGNLILEAYKFYIYMYGINYSSELHINYVIEQTLYKDFQNKFNELLLELQLKLLCLRKNNPHIKLDIEDINENYIKNIFKNMIENITDKLLGNNNKKKETDKININEIDNSIQQNIFNILIKYCYYKKYDENILNILLELSNTIKKDSFIDIISENERIYNYNNYKIFYTWENFLKLINHYTKYAEKIIRDKNKNKYIKVIKSNRDKSMSIKSFINDDIISNPEDVKPITKNKKEKVVKFLEKIIRPDKLLSERIENDNKNQESRLKLLEGIKKHYQNKQETISSGIESNNNLKFITPRFADI
jgi:hypothetical protein